MGRSVFQVTLPRKKNRHDCTPPQAGGAHVGKNVQIHWRGFSGCPELDLITLGDDVYIGTAAPTGWESHALGMRGVDEIGTIPKWCFFIWKGVCNVDFILNTCSATHAQECVLIVVSLGFFHSFHQHSSLLAMRIPSLPQPFLGGALYSHKFAATSLAYSAVKVGQGMLSTCCRVGLFNHRLRSLGLL